MGNQKWLAGIAAIIFATAGSVVGGTCASASILHATKYPACPSPTVVGRVAGTTYDLVSSGGGVCQYAQHQSYDNDPYPPNISLSFTEKTSTKSKFKAAATKRFGSTAVISKVPGVGQATYQAIFTTPTPTIDFYVLAKNGKILEVDYIGTPSAPAGFATQLVTLARAEMGK